MARNKRAELPDLGAYLWAWFVELSAARSGNGFGENPIGYTEIAAWAALTGRDLTPWEVSVLRRLDAVTLAAWAEKSKQNS